MPREISSVAREQIQSSNVTHVALVLLEIDHPDMAAPIRVVNNNENIVYDGNEYLATSFRFTPPAQEGNELRDASVSISNVDRRFVQTLRSVSSPPTIKAIVVLVGETVEKEAGPWEFILAQANYDADVIQGVLTQRIFFKDRLSTIRVNVNNFPSLIQP